MKPTRLTLTIACLAPAAFALAQFPPTAAAQAPEPAEAIQKAEAVARDYAEKVAEAAQANRAVEDDAPVTQLAPANPVERITLADGDVLLGRLRQVTRTGFRFVPADDSQSPRQIAWPAVRRVEFVPPERWGQKDTAVTILRDDEPGLNETTGRIKLRRGTHRFQLAFVQKGGAAQLDLRVKGPGLPNFVSLPASMFARYSGNWKDAEPSPGFDEEGYRLSEKVKNLTAGIGVRYAPFDASAPVHKISDLRWATSNIAYRRGSKIDLSFPHEEKTNYIAVFTGVFRPPADGEYTFQVRADDFAHLGMGQVAPGLSLLWFQENPDLWDITLADECRGIGPLAGWDEQTGRFDVLMGQKNNPVAVPVELPRAYFKECWRLKVQREEVPIERIEEPPDLDTIYAAGSGGTVQGVSGELLRIDNEKIHFRYLGTERTVDLQRVVGIVFRRTPENTQPLSRDWQILHFVGPVKLPGRLVEAKERMLVFQLIGSDEPLQIDRRFCDALTDKDSRYQPLDRFPIAEVEQTPFFDRLIAFQRNRSVSGAPLQIGDQQFEQGLCLHSRTKLTFDLKKDFATFKATVGLQAGESQGGDCVVHFRADGEPLREPLHLKHSTNKPPEPIDVEFPVQWRESFTLEVDFGGNFDVGDNVVFAGATLLRDVEQ